MYTNNKWRRRGEKGVGGVEMPDWGSHVENNLRRLKLELPYPAIPLLSENLEKTIILKVHLHPYTGNSHPESSNVSTNRNEWQEIRSLSYSQSRTIAITKLKMLKTVKLKGRIQYDRPSHRIHRVVLLRIHAHKFSCFQNKLHEQAL